MSLKGIAKATVSIQDRGSYTAPSGEIVNVEADQRAAVAGTLLYTPERLAELVQEPAAMATPTRFSVVNEKTQHAAHRLVQDEGCDDLVVLNFASARNVGGGFINGAKAQEEDVARCSGIYRC